ncbi:LysE family translocator [Microbaculum marinum]|uniref:LysE family translocator n=1 Tax=Microbaculum marinum TaxID=1764581 RepID=A0AAW9RHZ1_9HYPH
MTLEIYLAFVAACVLIVIVPGPTVTVIIANSLSYGTRAGLLNVAGTQLGLAVMIGVLLVGLASIIETMGWWFDWLRLAGAAYLVWLGYKLIRSGGGLDAAEARRPPRGGFFLQGLLVIFANPKALLFFGAFIPQFVDPQGDYVRQVLLLGATFMAVATVLDGTYAVLSGGAGAFLTRQRVRLVSRVSGVFLIGGGIWLAMARAR